MAVYFFAWNGRIKIGTSTKVRERIVEWQRVLKTPIEMLGAVHGGRAEERALHFACGKYHVEGEWFQDCPELRQSLTELVSSSPIPVPSISVSRQRRAPKPNLKRSAAKQSTPPQPFGPSITIEQRKDATDRAEKRFFGIVSERLRSIRFDPKSLAAETVSLIESELDDVRARLRTLAIEYVEAERPPFDSRDKVVKRIGQAQTLVENLVVCSQN